MFNKQSTIRGFRTRPPQRTGLALLLAGTILGGCSSRVIVSEKQAFSPLAGQGEAGGLVYALPQTLIAVDGTQDPTSGQVTYKFTPSVVGDPKARYRLRFVSNGLSDDNVNLSVDPNGLLASGTATITDQTAAVIIALASTASAVASVPISPFSRAVPTPATKPSPGPYPFHKVFSVAEFLSNPPLPDGATIQVQPSGIDVSTPAPDCAFSVCYRSPVTVRGAVFKGGKNVGAEFSIVVVDPSSTEGIDIKSAPLVPRTGTVTFTSGMATSNAINQSSTVLAAANLPLNVIKAILSAPASLLQLKVTNVTDAASLATQQVTLANQLKALATLQQAQTQP